MTSERVALFLHLPQPRLDPEARASKKDVFMVKASMVISSSFGGSPEAKVFF